MCVCFKFHLPLAYEVDGSGSKVMHIGSGHTVPPLPWFWVLDYSRCDGRGDAFAQQPHS